MNILTQHSEEKTLELIINRWMIRIGRTPTWKEVAGLVKYSGFPQLADAISGVYVTGERLMFSLCSLKYTTMVVIFFSYGCG